MSQAQVQSIDALKAFRFALAKFLTNNLRAMEAAQSEIGRTQEWIEHDRPSFWARQLELRQQALVRAKAELDRARGTTMFGLPVSVIDEKKAVDRCRRALASAEEKIAATRRWKLILDREFTDSQGPFQQFLVLLEVDGQEALAALDRMIEALEKYADLRDESGKPIDRVSPISPPNAAPGASPLASKEPTQ